MFDGETHSRAGVWRQEKIVRCPVAKVEDALERCASVPIDPCGHGDVLIARCADGDGDEVVYAVEHKALCCFPRRVNGRAAGGRGKIAGGVVRVCFKLEL